MSGDEESASAENADRAYFRALEETLVELRGKAILLSPEDWHAARRWREAGIPLELVQRAMAEVWERRRARGRRGRVSSLRYFSAAVEAAWSEQQELGATGLRQREPEVPFEPLRRLEKLAAALPTGWPRAAQLARRLRALDGDAEAIESELARLENEVLSTELAALEPEARTALDAEIERALAPALARLPVGEVAVARERLLRQRLRQRLGLPLLSLFSPAAQIEPDAE